MTEPNKPTEQEEDIKTLPLLWQEVKNLARSKNVRIVAAVFLVLLLLGSVVPVGKIPFLRNLVWAMGYSSEETENISFLKALLTWNEHNKIMNGERQDPDGSNVFAGDSGSLKEQLEKAKASQLFNLRALNASLARQGRALDALATAYSQVDTGDGIKRPGVAVPTDAVAKTQANSTQQAEVYFGTDSSALARNPKDGFDSTQTLKKIANANIAGGSGTDWFMRAVDKAKSMDSGLTALTQTLKKGGGLTPLNINADFNTNKARRDLYYVWLTSMAAKRAKNPGLSKMLAGAGFSGAEMPKRVFDSSGMAGGMGIDPNSMVAEMDSIKMALHQEEMCNATLKDTGGSIDEQISSSYEAIKSLPGSFPASCDDVNGNFTNNLAGIRNSCKAVEKAYSNLNSTCGVKMKNAQTEKCTTLRLEDKYDTYSNYCEQEKERCQTLATLEEQEACMAARKKSADYEGVRPSDIEATVNDTFARGADFFPEPEWGSSIGEDLKNTKLTP